jgi:hypothetical protein
MMRTNGMRETRPEGAGALVVKTRSATGETPWRTAKRWHDMTVFAENTEARHGESKNREFGRLQNGRSDGR